MGNNKQTLHNYLGDKEADKLIDFVQNGAQEDVVPKQKCAVKVVATGEHCPETGMHPIDGGEDYLCDKCYKNWLHTHPITPNDLGKLPLLAQQLTKDDVRDKL